jgi:hypothetical protein
MTISTISHNFSTTEEATGRAPSIPCDAAGTVLERTLCVKP